MDDLNSKAVPSLSKDEIEKKIQLGRDILSGNTEGYSAEDAFALFSEAAAAGDPEAKALAGECLYFGNGTEKNLEEALRLATESADEGDPRGITLLGGIYYDGLAVERDDSRAISLFTNAAFRDFAEAQYMLGLCYYDGHGTEQDLERARYWMQKAADQGSEDAEDELFNIERDILEASSQENAADDGEGALPKIISDLADLLENTDPFDDELRDKFSRKFLDIIGDPDSYDDPEVQYNLYGSLLELSKTLRDEEMQKTAREKALHALETSAVKGNFIKAKLELGRLYLMSTDKESHSAAVDLFRQAARQNSTEAMKELSFCYHNGFGVEKDLDMAVYWMKQAYDQASFKDLSFLYAQGLSDLEKEKKEADEKKAHAERGKQLWSDIEYSVYGLLAAAGLYLMTLLYRALGSGFVREPLIPVHGILRLILIVIAVGGIFYSAMMLFLSILSLICLEEFSPAPAGFIALLLAVGLGSKPEAVGYVAWLCAAGAAIDLLVIIIKLLRSKHRRS